MGKEITICAIIAVRNEAQYLRYLLPMLAEQDIDVVIIDNESTDESKALYELHKNRPVIEVVNQPYSGKFSLTDQLVLKKDIYGKLSHDWLVHHDADEIFQHKLPGHTFRNAIEEADANGYNVLNFEEFVFLPEYGVDNFNTNHFTSLDKYYFFKPGENRLNRAWKRNAQIGDLIQGGHSLSGENLNIDPSNHILRHYIVKSEWHAINKYLNRSFV